MAKGIVAYYSRSGSTKEMAEIIAGAMNQSIGRPDEKVKQQCERRVAELTKQLFT